MAITAAQRPQRYQDRHSSQPSPSPGGLCFGAPEPGLLPGLRNAASRLPSTQMQPSVMTCLPAVYQLNCYTVSMNMHAAMPTQLGFLPTVYQLNCLNSLDEHACSNTNTPGASGDHVQKHKVSGCAASVQMLCTESADMQAPKFCCMGLPDNDNMNRHR